MPSPIAHMAAGVAIYGLSRLRRAPVPAHSPMLLVACVGLSLVPDLDAALGIALGNLGRYHNNFGGSPIFGAVVALAAGLIAGIVRPGSARAAAGWTVLCYQVHVLMDFLTVSRGVMLLWPFSEARFSPPVHLFYGVRWSDGLISARHLITLGTELLFVLGLVFVWWCLRRRRVRGVAGEGH